MSVALDPARLAYEMAIRGLSSTDLARKAGLSRATVSVAISGTRIADDSAKRIAKVLDTTPIIAMLLQLVAPVGQPPNGEEPMEPAIGPDIATPADGEYRHAYRRLGDVSARSIAL